MFSFCRARRSGAPAPNPLRMSVALSNRQKHLKSEIHFNWFSPVPFPTLTPAFWSRNSWMRQPRVEINFSIKLIRRGGVPTVPEEGRASKNLKNLPVRRRDHLFLLNNWFPIKKPVRLYLFKLLQVQLGFEYFSLTFTNHCFQTQHQTAAANQELMLASIVNKQTHVIFTTWQTSSC